MEQIKRPCSNIIHEYDERKRKKIDIKIVETHCLRKESVTAFEDLSNELIYEIFEFLDFHHASQGFYDLNERFQNLFAHSNLPIKINISSISKCTFHHYFTQIIIPHVDRIKSLHLSNPFATDMSLLLFPIMKNLTRLETLIINGIESRSIEKVVNHLSSLPVLSSLLIISIDDIRISNDIYQKIFRLPTLKYCQISIETEQHLQPLPIATKEFSSIEHLIINNKVSLNQLDSLLSYVPQLRRLSFGCLDGYRRSRIHKSSITLNYLTNVSLKLFSISFNDFELFVSDFFRQVHVLHITACHMQYPISHMEYLNADRWERLISTHMSNLRIFDFQHKGSSWLYSTDRQAYETEISKFNSLFWMKHQWFFEHQYYIKKYFDTAIFYSINPYRRKKYMLGEGSDNNNLQTNVDSVHYVHIHNTNAMTKFVGSFPNTTELTLSETFDVPRDSIAVDLNRIIPLRQLIKLTIECHRLPFEQIIELLHFTPNIHTLKLDSLLLYRTDCFSIQQNKIFQIVSNTNTVTNLTIEKEITLEKMQLLVTLFPRLEYITINLYEEVLEPITRFLLSKPNNNTRYLSSLCVSKQRTDFMENLRVLIESEKLLHDYTLKIINRKLYLWW